MSDRLVEVVIERTTVERATVQWPIDAEDYANWLGGLTHLPWRLQDYIETEPDYDDILWHVLREDVEWETDDLHCDARIVRVQDGDPS